MDPDGSLEIQHVVLVARLLYLVLRNPALGVTFPGIPRNTMEAESAHPFGPFLIVAEDHPTLASSHIFDGMKAEYSEFTV